MIRFSCPNCSRTFSTPERNAGRGFKCKHCGAAMTIPDPGPTNKEGNAAPDLGTAGRNVRSLAWRLCADRIRQAARRVYDLPRFGTGILERMCASLVVAAAFFLITLLASALIGAGRDYGFAAAGVALVTVLAVSAVLVSSPPDDELAGNLADRLSLLHRPGRGLLVHLHIRRGIRVGGLA